jgi:hypothetical protein
LRICDYDLRLSHLLSRWPLPLAPFDFDLDNSPSRLRESIFFDFDLNRQLSGLLLVARLKVCLILSNASFSLMLVGCDLSP